MGEIEIGENVVISQKSYLCAASHDYLQSNFAIFAKKISIEDQCWLATDVFIAPGITMEKELLLALEVVFIKICLQTKFASGTPLKL